MRALCTKYNAKLKNKPENKKKIMDTIICHLNNRDINTDTDWEYINSFFLTNYPNKNLKTLIIDNPE